MSIVSNSTLSNLRIGIFCALTVSLGLGSMQCLESSTVHAQLPLRQSTPGISSQSSHRNHAIVQLQGLQLSPPQLKGTANVPLIQTDKPKRLTIYGSIQQQPEPFLVDTGASTTLLAKSLVSRLGLAGQAISGDRLASAVAGNDCPTMDAHLHRLPPLKIGALEVENLQGLTFVNTTLPDGLSGVLGMNLLNAFDLKVNPTTRQVSLTSPTPLPPHQRSQAIPLQNKLGVMLAQLHMNQTGPFTFLLDTGAESTFISPEVAQVTQAAQLPRQDVRVRGFCGLEPAYRVSMPSLQFGQYSVQNVDTIVLDSTVIKTLQVDGILGQNVLRQFSQHWRFATASRPQGSLLLTPISSP